MSEKRAKVYDELVEVFCQAVFDLTDKIIDSVTSNEGIARDQKKQVEDLSKQILDIGNSVTHEIVRAFTPVVDNLKEGFYKRVIPTITENMEHVVIKINEKVIKREEKNEK